MKRIFAVVLLLLSFASVAVADGGGGKPPVCPGGVLCTALNGTSTKPHNASVALLVDGSGGKPPVGGAAMPSQGSASA